MPTQIRSANLIISSGGAAGIWSNTSSGFLSDDLYVITSMSAATSNWIVATSFNFSFQSNSIVSGIILEVERNGNDAVRDTNVTLIVNNTGGGNNKALTSVLWPAADSTALYGGNTDTWGLTLNSSNVTSPLFGVRMRVTAADLQTANVDRILLTVDYIDPSVSQASNAQNPVSLSMMLI